MLDSFALCAIIHNMNIISADSYTMSFYVDTKHGNQIEFVISDAESRNGKEDGYYLDHLTATIDQWLKPYKEAYVQDTCCYGSIHITVSAKNVSDLSAIKTSCSYAVDDWRKRYRINHMKRSA